MIEAGRASVIVAINPIFIALLAAYLFKERLTVVKIIGIILSVGGAINVISRGQVFKILHAGF